MTSEVIVDVSRKDISIALLEDKKLVEYQREARTEHFSIGNIYLAKVKKLMPGLNAGFVGVGHPRDAFLHYLDLGTTYRSLEKYMQLLAKSPTTPSPEAALRQPILEKEGSIQNILKPGQQILVQIVKEPINTKGPRLSCDLSFPGRLLVLVPFGEKVSISSKIKSATERARLKQLISSIKPKGFGVIVRTACEGKRAGDLDNEMRILLDRWNQTIEKTRKAIREHHEPPKCVFEETGRTVALLRDLFNPSYENIYVNDPSVYNEVKNYVSLIAPERSSIVKLYESKVPIFDNFSVTKQIKTSLGRNVTYKHGAYLIIEQTEALHVVDVNSGNRSRSNEDQEANAIDVNLGAADELARQLRLRDMGGIIVVDFIDMNLPEHRQQLYERMVENMRNDRARHTILPLSKFGLMQITRQRVRPAMDLNVEETCPTCGGTGTIRPSILFTDTLETKVDMMVNRLHIKRFTLYVHPFVAAYLSQGVISIRRQWQLKYGLGVKVLASQELAYLDYRFVDSKGEEVAMNTPNEMK